MELHPYLRSIVTSLSLKNKYLQFKSGSFLNNLNLNELSQGLGDKLLAEVSMFKTDLFPVMKYFKQGIDSIIRKKPTADEVIHHEFIQLPITLNQLCDLKTIRNNHPSYNALYPELKYIDRNELTGIDNPVSLFITDQEPLTQLVQPILIKMNPMEMKSFYRTYCACFIRMNDSMEDEEQIDYKTLLTSPLKAILNADKICLIWASIMTRIAVDRPSNLDLQSSKTVLHTLKEDLQNAMTYILSTYEQYVNNKVVVLTDSSQSNQIYLISPNMDQFVNEAQHDAWTAVYGSSAYIWNVIDPKEASLSCNLNKLLKNEEMYIKGYNKFVEYEMIKLKEKYIQQVRKLILTIANESYGNYITENLLEYTSHKTRNDFERAAISYIQSLPDQELIGDTAKIASKLIGEILFDQTHFGLFLRSQQELDSEFIEKFSITPDEEISLWTINYLSRFLVSQLEVVP